MVQMGLKPDFSLYEINTDKGVGGEGVQKPSQYNL